MKTSMNRIKMKAVKHSPEIMLGVGAVGLVVTGWLAYKATKEAKLYITETNETMAEMKEHELTPEEITQVTVSEYTDLTKNMIKVYALPVVIGVVSTGLLLKSHNIMAGRMAAAVSAYAAISKSFDKYRENVITDAGEDKDFLYKTGLTPEEYKKELIDAETGEKTKEDAVKFHETCASASDYGRFFDETNDMWHANPEMNLMFLRATQTEFNDLLIRDGFVFLNDVYKKLGIPRTKSGSIVGWMKDGDGDGVVDFGIYDIHSSKCRDFVNGDEPAILLDFNVDGIIWDKI